MPVTVFFKILIASVLASLCVVGPASSDMLISPTRAMMDEDDRSATFTLRNTSDGSRTYRLSWEDKKSDSFGGLQKVSDDEEWPSLEGMVRFSPRQIKVGAGENQTVRLSFRPPSDLAKGEYRSHLLLQVVAEESEPTSVVNMEHPDVKGATIQLFMQTSFSIPVVARYEVSPPNVTIADIEVVPASGERNMALRVTLEKDGNSSSYGDLVVEMQKDQGSPVETIGRRAGLNIFHELNRRVVEVPLRDKSIPSGSWIRIAYEGIEEYGDILWDERIFQSK